MANNKTTGESGKRARRLVLNGNLDISGVAALHGKLIEYANKDANVNIYTEKVLTIDTSSLQLLLAFVRQVSSLGHRVNWRNPSEALLKTAALTGLDRELGLV